MPYHTRLQAKKEAEAKAKAEAEVQTKAEAEANAVESQEVLQLTQIQMNRVKQYMNRVEELENEQRIDMMIELFSYLKGSKEVWTQYPRFRGVMLSKIDEMLEVQIPRELNKMHSTGLNVKRQQQFAEFKNVLVDLRNRVTQ